MTSHARLKTLTRRPKSKVKKAPAKGLKSFKVVIDNPILRHLTDIPPRKQDLNPGLSVPEELGVLSRQAERASRQGKHLQYVCI
jgi:hypothetical protein